MRGKTIIGGIAATLVVLVLAPAASAATLEVTKAGDPVPGACTPNDCTLREAVRRANSTAAPDRIVLKARTYAFEQIGTDDDATAGDLDIVPATGRTTIAGKGTRRTTIDGNDIDRLFDVPGGGRLTVTGVTLRDGSTGSTGGAIRSDGSVTVTRAAISSNVALGQAGAVYSAGNARLIMNRTTLRGNDGSDGGAIYNQNQSRATLKRLVLRGNQADDEGGAIYNQNDAVMTLTKSTLDRNTSMSPFNGGGAIFNQNQAELRIKASTISRNRAPLGDGGGIYTRNDSLLALTNVTLSGNQATEGGALYTDNFPLVTISFTTIAKNVATVAGGGIFDAADPPGPPGPAPFLRVRGTLVGANGAPGGTDNCAAEGKGLLQSVGGNVEDANSCRFTKGSDTRNGKAGLRRLARNGGPTRTHALKPASDAVNGAKRKGCPKRDQRGVKRPQGKSCDSGSYELKRR